MATNSNGGNTAPGNTGTINRGVSSRLGSFAGTHPDFKHDVPDSFKRAPATTHTFDLVRDPFVRTQMADMQKTEAERREGGNGDGSRMVKRHKPMPVLKPKTLTSHPATRQTFNHEWLEEQRLARMRGFARARAERNTTVFNQAQATQRKGYSQAR